MGGCDYLYFFHHLHLLSNSYRYVLKTLAIFPIPSLLFPNFFGTTHPHVFCTKRNDDKQKGNHILGGVHLLLTRTDVDFLLTKSGVCFWSKKSQPASGVILQQ